MSINDVSDLQVGAAFALLCIPWVAYQRWRLGAREEVPLFPLIGFAYWVFFALPLFWGDRNALGSLMVRRILSDEAITSAVLMSLLGVLAIWSGMKVKLGRLLSPKNMPDIPANPSRWGYLRLILILGTLVSSFEAAPHMLGEGGRQIMVIFGRVIPLVAFAILFREYVNGNSTKADKRLIFGFIIFRFLIGIATGWLGAFALLIVTCAVIYLSQRKRVPRLAIAGVIVYVLFFQVGKSAVREKYWYDNPDADYIERADFWVSTSSAMWYGALTGSSEESVRDLAYQSLSRLSLLTQTANVLELTPSVIPYQHGRLYSYMAVTLIPRLIWPDKPSVTESNHFYQLSYGLTSEENLDRVSIGVGFLTESFINFGWLGVILIMFTLGVLLDFLQKTFLNQDSSLLFWGIGIALLPSFLTIESQLAQYLGGLVQKILFTCFIFLPIIRFKERQRISTEVLKREESAALPNPSHL